MSEEQAYVVISLEVRNLLEKLAKEDGVELLDTTKILPDGLYQLPISKDFAAFLLWFNLEPDNLIREAFGLPTRGA